MTQQGINNRETNAKLYAKLTRIFGVGLAFLFGVSLVLPLMGQAAELYLETSQPEYAPNETFVADIRLNVIPPENINAIEAYLSFPKDILEAVDFSTGNSILTFIEEPKINQEKGLISFVGIIPGGYSGQLIGDPGKSNLLGRIVFQVRETDAKLEHPEGEQAPYGAGETGAKVEFLESSKVLLNDGKGTPAKLITKGVIVEIVAKPLDYAQGKNEWQEELEKDKIPPEDFKPEIVKIDDKYFLVFNSQDKQSGIAYYAIRETRRKISLKRETDAKWAEAESPCVLKDQKLRSYIYVKAVDKAGNERVAVVEPKYPIRWYELWWIWFIIILGLGVVYLVGRILWKKSRNIRKT